MRRALSAIFGSIMIIGVIAAIAYFVITSSNQPAKISFVTNGGSTIEVIQVEPGNTIEAPEEPIKEGYTFTGWYIDRGLTSKYHFSKMPDKSITLYAGWEEKVLTISFYLPLIQDGSFVYENSELVLNSRAYTQKKVGYGQELTQSNIPSSLLENYTGYTGIWKFYNEETGDEITELTDIKVDIVAKPVFSVKHYNLYFYIGSASDGVLYDTISVPYDSSVVLPEANPTKRGHTFKYWTYVNDAREEVELDEIKLESLSVREDLSFGSDYSINSYYVHFYSNQGELIDTQYITYGTLIEDKIDKTRDDMKKTGYAFASWKTAEGRVNLSEYIIAEDVELYPDYDRAYFKVSFFYNDPNTGDKMIWNPATTQYEKASEVFSYSDRYEYESVAEFPALPSLVNFKGVDWIGFNGSSGFTVTNEVDIEVEFERIAYIIKFSGNDPTTFLHEGKEVVISVNENISEVWNSKIKNVISTPQKNGFEFYGWNTTADGSGNSFNKDFKLEDDLTVYADWYSLAANDWTFDVQEIDGVDYAIIKSYKGSSTKVKLPDVVYANDGSPVDVYQLGTGGTFGVTGIENINYLFVSSNIVKIAPRAFLNKGLISVKFAEGSKLQSIGERAFSCDATNFDSQKSVMRVELPASVSDISDSAFRNAARLTSIIVDSDNSYYKSIDGVLYDKALKTLYAIPNRTTIKAITIPATVEKIMPYASSYESNMKAGSSNAPTIETIYIEDNSKLHTIGEKAFYNNLRLTKFALEATSTYTNLPNLETIEKNAFTNTSIGVFNPVAGCKLKTIGREAFSDCLNLTSLSIPGTVNAIGDAAFSNCQRITSVVYPGAVSYVSKSVFNECVNLTNFSFAYSSTITYIDESAFYNSGITSINLSNLPYLQDIKKTAFYGTKLVEVDLEGAIRLTKVGDSAFASTPNLTTFKINAALETLATDAISKTPSLSVVTVENGNTKYTAEGNVLYNIDKTELIIYPSGLANPSFTVPNSVVTISKYAFSLNNNIVTLNLSNSVKTINSYAFDSCSKLVTVMGFDNVESLGTYAFNLCTSLTTVGGDKDVVTINDKIAKIPSYAFYYCTSITTVKGLSNCTTIEEYAFSYCSTLVSFCSDNNVIAIPSSVNSIGNYAFAFNTGMVSVEIPKSVTIINQNAFRNNTNLQTVSIANESNLKTLGDSAFSYCTSLESFNFLGLCALTHIGNGTTGQVFYGCTSLRTIDLSKCTSLIEISEQSFYNTAITTITIPASVAGIGDEAFANCSNLVKITFNGAAPNFGSDVFYQPAFNPNMVIYVPDNYKSVYKNLLGDYAEIVQGV